MGAVVPHLSIISWRGCVEERPRPASVTSAGGCDCRPGCRRSDCYSLQKNMCGGSLFN